MLNNVFSSQLLGSAVLPFALICVSQFTRWQRRVQNVGYKWDPANMHARTRARTHALARALSLSQSVGMNSQVINVTSRELRRRAVNSETEASALRRLGSHDNTQKKKIRWNRSQ